MNFHTAHAEFPELEQYPIHGLRWYMAYRDLHLAKYPDSDAATRRNLDEFVDRADTDRVARLARAAHISEFLKSWLNVIGPEPDGSFWFNRDAEWSVVEMRKEGWDVTLTGQTILDADDRILTQFTLADDVHKSMRGIRVIYDDGQSNCTSINGTVEEIRRYYIGKQFEYDETKPMHTAVKVEFLD